MRAGLTLRELADRAGTSHATIAAYEAGRKVPRADTLERIVNAAGFRVAAELLPSPTGPDPAARGQELLEALELADMFPARRTRRLKYPKFEAA